MRSKPLGPDREWHGLAPVLRALIRNESMKTDKQLYAIFGANPEWIIELTAIPSPGECELKSVTIKGIKQEADAVLYPKDPK